VSQISLLAMFVCIVTPIASGCAVVFFMIKPIFVRRRRESVAVVHNPAFEPEIGDFIHAVCRAVGAPTPWRIEFDCTTDASAGFVGGWSGFLNGRLILRLGLPLVAAVTERELAGILAHEFGHFRQGVGMRLSFLIRRINAWFVRSVYGRDRWDERLAEAAESEKNWVGFSAFLPR
jgi:Zn-dependent protease with chaperone function